MAVITMEEAIGLGIQFAADDKKLIQHKFRFAPGEMLEIFKQRLDKDDDLEIREVNAVQIVRVSLKSNEKWIDECLVDDNEKEEKIGYALIGLIVEQENNRIIRKFDKKENLIVFAKKKTP